MTPEAAREAWQRMTPEEPNPTSTLINEWLAGASEETKVLYPGGFAGSSVLAVYDYLQERRRKQDSRALAEDSRRLRTLILRRLDGAERARAFAREALNEYRGTPVDQREAYDMGRAELADGILEALDA